MKRKSTSDDGAAKVAQRADRGEALRLMRTAAAQLLADGGDEEAHVAARLEGMANQLEEIWQAATVVKPADS